MALPGVDEVPRAAFGMEDLAPDHGHADQVVGGGQHQDARLHQHPGDGGGIAQVDGQLQVRCGEEGMLAGQPADLAGEVRVERQVTVPELLVALVADAIESASVAAVQRGAQCRLAGSGTQQERFGGGGGALDLRPPSMPANVIAAIMGEPWTSRG